MKKIEIGPDDCAIVLRDGGKMELHIPSKGDDEPIAFNVALTAAFGKAVSQRSPLIQAMLREMYEEVEQTNRTVGVKV